MPLNPQDSAAIAAVIRQATAPLVNRIRNLESQLEGRGYGAGRMTYQDELDCIPGRRVAFSLVGTQDFTSSAAGTRGQAIPFLISVDGPFVMTHRPYAAWKTTTPTNATDFGRWRPVYSGFLPTQQLTTNFIDISYEIQDTGPTRNLQNDSVPGGLLSNPDHLKPLPVPTKFEPNSTISFIPIYESIIFGGSTATTGGRLVVVLPGYKIITTLGNG